MYRRQVGAAPRVRWSWAIVSGRVEPFDTAMGDRSMRRPVRLASSLAVGLGALLVAGPIAAPALAGHASMTAASPRRNGNDHVHSTAKAWKTEEWVRERRPAKAWKTREWVSDRRPAKAWRKASGG